MIKINVVSGFLGAGKTTLIRKLLTGSLRNEKVVLLLDLGYAAEGVRPTPTHEKTKSMEELVSYR